MGTIVDSLNMYMCTFSVCIFLLLGFASSLDITEVFSRPDIAGTCVPEYGVDYTIPRQGGSYREGYFKKIYNVASWPECGKLCYKDEKCTHWTWRHINKNQCFLHTDENTSRRVSANH